MTDFGDLFERQPWRWGLRGDVHLWNLMREEFRETALPANPSEVQSLIEKSFLAHTGTTIIAAGAENTYVESLATGRGISDGHVHHGFWQRTAVPLIIDRWLVATSSTEGAVR